MDEITRQEYLDSMGIQSYFPRYILPAAKESEQCEWPVGFKQEKHLKVEHKQTVNKEPLSASIKSKEVEEIPPQTQTIASETSESSAEEVRFQLVMIQVNNDALVLVLLPYIHTSNALNAIQKQLFINIFNSIYQEPVVLNFDIKPFRWPFSEARHIEKDGAAAKASLGAYLEQLKEKFSFKRFILMGDKVAPFIEAGDSFELLVCRSLDEMLKMPQLKHEAWNLLKKKL